MQQGSVGTADQGKGRVCREVKIGQAGRGKAQGGERPMGTTAYGGNFKERARVNGERPIGTASCRQQYIQASCQPRGATVIYPTFPLSSRGSAGQGATTPLPLPLSFPLPTATRSPAAFFPPGQDEQGEPRGSWAGGKGNTWGGNRAGQTALAKNGAERRRRQRKGRKGKNHCGC